MGCAISVVTPVYHSADGRFRMIFLVHQIYLFMLELSCIHGSWERLLVQDENILHTVTILDFFLSALFSLDVECLLERGLVIHAQRHDKQRRDDRCMEDLTPFLIFANACTSISKRTIKDSNKVSDERACGCLCHERKVIWWHSPTNHHVMD